MTQDLRFDAERHSYALDGEPLPGITWILRRAGIAEAPVGGWSEAARDRGTAVHLATQFLDEGDLDASTVDPRLSGYLEAWLTFKRETAWANAEAPELLVCSPVLRFATQIDRVGTMYGEQTLTLLNLKTSAAAYPWHAIQTAGEALAYAEWVGRAPLARLQRAGLRLAPDGTYKLDVHKDRRDLDVFRAARLVAAWREENGCTKY